MKHWRKVESEFLDTTSQITVRTDDPDVQLIIQFIQRHLYMNRPTQEFIAHSLESRPFSLTLEELREIWEMIEKNIQLLSRMIELTEEMLATTKGANWSRRNPSELSPPVLH